MPFKIVRNDITNMKVDAIVNAANPHPVIGHGVDSGIHKKAGSQLLVARKKIGDIPFGDAAITHAFDLHAKYVIHTVSPIWQNGETGECKLLKNCYRTSLKLAIEQKCKSIAFPLLGTGNHGFPNDIALQTAIGAISSFLMNHDMEIYLVVFNRSAVSLSEKLFQSVQSFIDETYIKEKVLEEYELYDQSESLDIDLLQQSEAISRRKLAEMECYPQFGAVPPEAEVKHSVPSPASHKLEDLMKEMDETFSEGLIRLIDQKGLKDPDVYKRANIDRKLFSKIKNNKNYKPGKTTCVAFAIALELSLDETRDLIGKAGYALTHSSKFDIIIEYFIMKKNYNTFEINEVLFAFDQPLIGS